MVDLHFGAFMADPFATIHRVYERLGLELGDESEARMREFLARHPPDLHGTHRYSFADTGLDAGELRARARRYQEYFDVPVRVGCVTYSIGIVGRPWASRVCRYSEIPQPVRPS